MSLDLVHSDAPYMRHDVIAFSPNSYVFLKKSLVSYDPVEKPRPMINTAKAVRINTK